MPFFDFHIHPSLKSFFSKKHSTDPLVRLKGPFKKIRDSEIPCIIKALSELAVIFRSQGNMQQLYDNEVKISGIAIYAPDLAMTQSKELISQAKTRLSHLLDPKRLEEINTGSPIDYILNDELPVILNPSIHNQPNKNIQVLRSKTDLNEGDPDTINVFFNLEGLHTLCDRPFVFNYNKIKSNLDRLLATVPILSANPCHIQHFPVCNQAYGIQFIKDNRFYPASNGISSLGGKLMKLLYDKDILLDIKHMSLQSRKVLFKQMDLWNGQSGKSEPIICTHAGFTGISYKDIRHYVHNRYNGVGRSSAKRLISIKVAKPAHYKWNSWKLGFNATSINLYDEEIFEILNRDGLIGISLDKRILGFGAAHDLLEQFYNFPLDPEVVYETEYQGYINPDLLPKYKIKQALKDGKCQDWKDIRNNTTSKARIRKCHLGHFMQHIGHVFKVADNYQLDLNKVSNQMCIGSDFDGLINPVSVCETMDSFKNFKQLFENNFEQFCTLNQIDLPPSFQISDFAGKLFYENGKKFILSRLQ